jgi:hypothetical protein
VQYHLIPERSSVYEGFKVKLKMATPFLVLVSNWAQLKSNSIVGDASISGNAQKHGRWSLRQIVDQLLGISDWCAI